MFADRKRTGRTDLEAVEMAFRAALHRAGAAALSQLLQFPGPAAEQRLISCSCGYQARYRELRIVCHETKAENIIKQEFAICENELDDLLEYKNNH